MSAKKNPLKSKTNWVAMAGMWSVVPLYWIPSFRQLVCENLDATIAGFCGLILLARNMFSNISRQKSPELNNLRILK
jgi:hypothetical protein